MKKLRKIGKIAIPAVGVVAAGAGAVQTYGDYNKTDGTLMLQNIEAMTATSEFVSFRFENSSGASFYADVFNCISRKHLVDNANVPNSIDDGDDQQTTLNENLCPSGGVIFIDNREIDMISDFLRAGGIPACDGTGDVVPDSKGDFEVGICYRTR